MIDYQEMIVDGVLTALREIWWLFALVAAIAIIRTPIVKGWIGEALVRLSARMLLKSAVYRPFHNVTLRDERGTTQIDHIFVSPYGVFVVETKNMKGWIFRAFGVGVRTQSVPQGNRQAVPLTPDSVSGGRSPHPSAKVCASDLISGPQMK